MATAPATPAQVSVSQTVISNAPPGNWRHPRLDEINQRLNATTFNERNARQIALNVALLLLTFFLPVLIPLSTAWIALARSLGPYYIYLVYCCRAVPLINIAAACAPLLRAKDDLSDIPLTPSQRALLGLQPNSTPVTPGSPYLTPPRYSRSSTPGSRSNSPSSSPYSGSSLGTGGGATPYSPSASPLFQKAVGREATRRLSYGTPSPLSLNRAANESTSSLTPNHTPSPSTGRGASVGLNSRWLYERSRASSQFKNLYAS